MANARLPRVVKARLPRVVKARLPRVVNTRLSIGWLTRLPHNGLADGAWFRQQEDRQRQVEKRVLVTLQWRFLTDL